MKLKYYLKGFGAGVLFATMILSVSFLLRAGGNAGMTDAQIMARARELGMETVGGTGSEKQGESESLELETETTDAAGAAIEPAQPVVGQEGAETPEQDTKPEIAEGTEITIEILMGMSSEEACYLLEEAGLVESASDMMNYLKENNMTALVRAGSFKLLKGMSLQEIAEKICG